MIHSIDLNTHDYSSETLKLSAILINLIIYLLAYDKGLNTNCKYYEIYYKCLSV